MNRDIEGNKKKNYKKYWEKRTRPCVAFILSFASLASLCPQSPCFCCPEQYLFSFLVRGLQRCEIQ